MITDTGPVMFVCRRKEDGLWFRNSRKSYGEARNQWVDDITKAKLYEQAGYVRTFMYGFISSQDTKDVPYQDRGQRKKQLIAERYDIVAVRLTVIEPVS